MPDLSLLERRRTCSIARTLSVVGDLWTSLIIRETFFGTRRFDDFQRNLSIAPNILSGRLKRLVEQQILFKSQYGDWPVRHEYRLTERGSTSTMYRSQCTPGAGDGSRRTTQTST